MRVLLKPVAALLAVLLPVAAATAQESELETALRYGREALAAQRSAEAYQHLLFALARSPEPAPIARLLLENAALDADARALWAHDWLAFAADARGKATLNAKDQAALPQDDPWPVALAQARAAAVADLIAFRDRHARSRKAGDATVAEWCEDLARRLARGSPALTASLAGKATPQLDADRAMQHATVEALQKLARAAASTGDDETALRAGRALAGLADQAATFEEKSGGPEPPDLEAAAADAGDAIRRARAALDGEVRVWTIEELEAMDEAEARAFTVAHASFAHPGVTWSPQDWYRVETGCGHGTLLGVATTVEDHHQRLVNWYGQDPFVGKPGIVRVVNESFGLEMEGAPFWWVGGFQGGDVTTVKFTIGTIPGLGRLLTHELTHRFDGAIYPGIPAWLAEGRAVWTGASYGAIVDRRFVEDHADWGAMAGSLNLGYGSPDKLLELLEGSIEEYRDNYTVGYALWVYLRSWSGAEDGGQPLYAGRLEEYMKACGRSRKDPADLFLGIFADGEDGRPLELEEFSADFTAFLRGFYWKEPAPWTKRYNNEPLIAENGAVVYDEPTWTWQRHRAEPWFGQDHARVAAELLAEQGQEEEAARAFHWSLAVDEPPDAALDAFTHALEGMKHSAAAWCLRRWLRFDSPRRHDAAPGPAPFLRELRDVEALLAARAAAARDYAGRGWTLAAAALAAEHDELAWSLGLPALDLTIPAETIARIRARDTGLHPFDAPSRWIGLAGFAESGLTGHEDRRVAGLWYVDPRGDVHVGRAQPRGGTDTLDRASHWRDAFVHALEWQDPGRYVVRAQVEMTTSFVNGALLLGWTRRDRNLRASFNGGDYEYASGESEARAASDGLGWSVSGLFARGGDVGGGHDFHGDRTTFAIEAIVDGPTLEFFLDGDEKTAWTMLDGRPIQGLAGFLTSQGAIRVIAPEVQRQDRTLWSAAGRAMGGGLHPTRDGAEDRSGLVGRPVSGLPLGAAGTVLLWFPAEDAARLAEAGEGAWRTQIEEVVATLTPALQDAAASQALTVVLPQELAVAEFDALRARFADAGLRGGLQWATHARGTALAESVAVRGWHRPLLGFADPAGVLRWWGQMSTSRRSLPSNMLEKMRQYQDHARPGVAGAAE
jgi:hypothetical protein